MKIFTIGFTRKSAEVFFTKLKRSGSKRIVDVRLNNVSQLAGFAKRGDLEFFLHEICGMGYVHLPDLAPTQGIIDDYRKNKGDWSVFEKRFLNLIRQREIEKRIDPAMIADGCLLCSEEKPHHCHRRLVADYLSSHWGDVEILHLV